MKRTLIQIISLFVANPMLNNLISGKLYKGQLKNICLPGLNCYSCPAAAFSCPLGALQTILGSIKYTFSFYVTGFLLLIGLLLGRAVCGYLCPFGLFQELLHKIKSPKFNLWRPLIYVKYLILLIFVIAIPLISKLGEPAFCEYICPAGTLEAALPMLATHTEYRRIIGELFNLKMTILIVTIIGCVLIYRFFCKLICPLGAIYGLMNRLSIYQLTVDESACIHCEKCKKICRMNINPAIENNSIECIRCGDCQKVCPKSAINLNMVTSKIKGVDH